MRSYYSAQRKLNVKVVPVKKNKALEALEALAGCVLMAFFPFMGMYCFIQLCIGNGN
jgi:hypothetical protein